MIDTQSSLTAPICLGAHAPPRALSGALAGHLPVHPLLSILHPRLPLPLAPDAPRPAPSASIFHPPSSLSSVPRGLCGKNTCHLQLATCNKIQPAPDASRLAPVPSAARPGPPKWNGGRCAFAPWRETRIKNRKLVTKSPWQAFPPINPPFIRLSSPTPNHLSLCVLHAFCR